MGVWCLALLILFAGGCSGVRHSGVSRPPSPLDKQLARQGVQIIQHGDNVTLMVPVSRLYISGTARFNASAMGVISVLVPYLKQSSKVAVDIAGYTDNTHPGKQDVALSRQQADRLSKILWDHRIGARIVSADGYGQAYPIAHNGRAGNADNRRIEIRFRRLIAPTA